MRSLLHVGGVEGHACIPAVLVCGGRVLGSCSQSDSWNRIADYHLPCSTSNPPAAGVLDGLQQYERGQELLGRAADIAVCAWGPGSMQHLNVLYALAQHFRWGALVAGLVWMLVMPIAACARAARWRTGMGLTCRQHCSVCTGPEQTAGLQRTSSLSVELQACGTACLVALACVLAAAPAC